MWNGNFKSALASLRKSKWRSILTMMGVIVGVSSVVTVVGLGEGLKHQVVGQINQLENNVITIRSGKLIDGGSSLSNFNLLSLWSTSTLTNQDVSAVNKLPRISEVVPFNFVTNSAENDNGLVNNIAVIGTGSDMPNVLNKQVTYGGFFTPEQANQRSAIIGSNVAAQMFKELNPVGHSFRILGTDFRVTGVLAPSSGGLLSVAQIDFNSAIFIPMQVSQNLNKGQNNILQIIARSNDENVDSAVTEVKKTLLQTHGGIDNFTVLKQDELLNLATGVVNTITGFISGIAAVSLLVGGIGIMDIMLASVSERTREIGIRKAIGATNRQVSNQFLIEGLALSVGGGLIGVVVALIINGILRIYTSLEPVVTMQVTLLAVAISIAIGIVFSVAPAVKASRKNPIDALRNE